MGGIFDELNADLAAASSPRARLTHLPEGDPYYIPADDTGPVAPAASSHWGNSVDELRSAFDDAAAGRPMAQPKAIPPPVSQGTAAWEGYLAGASSNFRDEIKGLSEASGLPWWLGGYRAPSGALALATEKWGIPGVKGDNVSPEQKAQLTPVGPGPIEQKYDKSVAETRGVQASALYHHPETYVAADLVGGLMQSAALPVPLVVKGAGVGPNALRSALFGSVVGGLSGAGAGETLNERLANATVGAPIGAAGGAIFGGLVGAMNKTPSLPGGVTAADVAQSLNRLRVNLPVGVVSDSPAVQSTTRLAAGLPVIGPSVIGRPVEAGLAQLGDRAETEAQRLAMGVGGQPANREQIGLQARSALQTHVASNEARADQAFSALRQKIASGGNEPVVTLNGILAPFNRIINSRAAARGASAANDIDIRGLENVLMPLTDPKGATFNGLQRARTELSKAIAWDRRNGGFYSGDLKESYGVISEAMRDAVRRTATSPDAEQAFAAANTKFAEMITKNDSLRHLLEHGSEEQLVDRVVSWGSQKPGQGNIAKLREIRGDLNNIEWNNIAGYSLQRMGLDAKGNFSPAIFLNRYQGISEEAKDLLFGAGGTGTRRFIDDIFNVSTRLQQSEKYINRSQTGAALGLSVLVGGGGAYEAGYLPLEKMGSILMGVGFTGGLLSLALSRPATARSLANWARAYAAVRMTGSGAAKALQVATRNFGATLGNIIGAPVLLREFADELEGGQPKQGAAPSAEEPNRGAPPQPQ